MWLQKGVWKLLWKTTEGRIKRRMTAYWKKHDTKTFMTCNYQSSASIRQPSPPSHIQTFSSFYLRRDLSILILIYSIQNLHLFKQLHFLFSFTPQKNLKILALPPVVFALTTSQSHVNQYHFPSVWHSFIKRHTGHLSLAVSTCMGTFLLPTCCRVQDRKSSAVFLAAPSRLTVALGSLSLNTFFCAAAVATLNPLPP